MIIEPNTTSEKPAEIKLEKVRKCDTFYSFMVVKAVFKRIVM